MDQALISNYILPFLLSALLSVILVYFVKRLSIKFKAVDLPDGERHFHAKPTPLWGGLAVYAAFAISAIIFYQAGLLSDGRLTGRMFWSLLVAGLILIIGGMLDDKYDFKPQQSIICPLIASSLMVWSGVAVNYVSNPLGGLIVFKGTVIASIVAFLWLMGMMYTTKLLDGLDGLVSGVSFIGAVILFLVSLFWDVPLSGTSILCLILAGTSLGFLFWNFNPAKIFLGEGGSVFLGFMLGLLAIISGAKIATALLIMGLPILDVVWIIYRRLFKEKRSPFVGGREHLHFRLLDYGFTQRQAVLFLYFLTTIFGSLALLSSTIGKIIALGFLAIFMLLLAWRLNTLNKT